MEVKPEEVLKGKRKSIYDISEEYHQLMVDLEDAEGVLDDDLLERLAINEKDRDDKLSNYKYILKIFDGKVKIEESYIEEHTAKKKAAEKAIERIKEYLRLAVETWGTRPIVKGEAKSKTLTFPEGKLVLIEKKFVDIIAENVIPDKYFKTTLVIPRTEYSKLAAELAKHILKIEHTVVKDSINEDVVNGVKLDGVREVTNSHVRIY